MEFEEMRKIWDSQNQEPLFAIDEAALYRRIQAKGRKASRIANMNEIGLIIIFIATSITLLIIERESFYSYLSAALTFLIAIYVWVGRVRRKKAEQQFDRTMLGELDQAIFNVENEITRARTFFWWMLLPAGLPTLLNMIQAGVAPWKWVIVPVAFVLAFGVVRWELRRRFLPRKRELEGLRGVLISE